MAKFKGSKYCDSCGASLTTQISNQMKYSGKEKKMEKGNHVIMKCSNNTCNYPNIRKQ